MLKERAKAVAYWVWTMDLVLTTAAFLLAWWLRSHIAPQLGGSGQRLSRDGVAYALRDFDDDGLAHAEGDEVGLGVEQD